MNRLLLPAGLVLAGLVVFDQSFDHDLRLSDLEQQARSTPEELSLLSRRLESERAEWTRTLEQRWAAERELVLARAAADAQQIAKLESLLAEQQVSIAAARQGLNQWESLWAELAPSAIQREFRELQVKLAAQEAELALYHRSQAESTQRAQREVRELEGKLTRTLAMKDSDQLWSDLVGPVVQLIGETTVGSGVLLESRALPEGGYATNVLTAWHVVRDIFGAPDNLTAPVPVKIYAPDGTWRNTTAHLLEHDAGLDLALLALDTAEHVPFGARLASRGELDTMRTFDGVYAVGCPLGNDPIPTVGELASTHHEIDGAKYWMISAPTYIGNSGGGIYAAKSHALIGIFSKIYTHGSTRSTIVPHMGLATPLSVVYDWLETTDYAFLETGRDQPEAQTAALTR